MERWASNVKTKGNIQKDAEDGHSFRRKVTEAEDGEGVAEEDDGTIWEEEEEEDGWPRSKNGKRRTKREGGGDKPEMGG